MSRVMESRMDGEKESRSGVPDGRPQGGREVRWSARRKEEVVLRLLRGEASTRWRGRAASRRGGSPGGARSSSLAGGKA